MSCSVASQGVKATWSRQRAGSQRKRAAKNQNFFLLLPILPQPYLKPQPQHPSPWVTHQLYPILNFRWIRLRRSYGSGSALSLSTHFYPVLFSSLKPHIAYMTLRTHFITKHAFYYMQSWKREILEHINCQNKLTTCYIKHWTFKVLLGLHTTDFHQSISTWRRAWLFMSAWYEIFQTNAHKKDDTLVSRHLAGLFDLAFGWSSQSADHIPLHYLSFRLPQHQIDRHQNTSVCSLGWPVSRSNTIVFFVTLDLIVLFYLKTIGAPHGAAAHTMLQ